MINHRIAFRFGKEFTQEQFEEAHKLLNFKDKSDTIKKLMAIGYTQLKYKAESIEKVKKVAEAYGVSTKDLSD
jgi:tRNA A37 N6-isopentenylltransferase MiaA